LKQNNRWRTNEQIRAPEVRLIGEDDKQIGVLKKEEALKMAKEKGVDLVEIAPKAKPPVVKIIEFGKFLYREEKKLKKQKKGSKTSELKEVRFSPFIADNDYKTRIERIEEFLRDRNKVRVTVKFKGREMSAKKFGYELVDRIVTNLGELAKVDQKPKFIGRHLIVTLSPTNAAKPKKEKRNVKNKNKKIT
jgi:translation initiation factor IF-3